MDSIAKNLEENKGFVKVRSSLDNVEYKVLDIGTSSEKLEVALILSKVRRDLNKLMIYLCKNPQLWINLPIAYGIIHTFDIHLPCLSYLLDDILTSDNPCELIIKNGNLFTIQEMTPNKYGIIGLNKPKEIKKIRVLKGNKYIDYEVADKRSIHLTIRERGKIDKYSKILLLAIHEITHTTCNDLYWKEDNHKYPYESYHTLMKEWSKSCGIK
jgi:hypothetical protein